MKSSGNKNNDMQYCKYRIHTLKQLHDHPSKEHQSRQFDFQECAVMLLQASKGVHKICTEGGINARHQNRIQTRWQPRAYPANETIWR